MPRTKEQIEQIRLERSSLIADVALKLFAEKGYKGTSISMIAKDAGISKGLLYNYYKSKEALLYEIMAHGISSLMVLFDDPKNGIISKDEMISLVDRSFDYMLENADFYRLFFSLLLQPGVYEMVSDEFWKAAAPFEEMMYAYFVSQKYADPAAEVALLFAILDGVGMHYLFRPDIYPISRVKKLIIDRIQKQSHS